MDSDMMSIASAYSGMQMNQLQTAVQTQLLRNAMDAQTQLSQELLQGMAGPSVKMNPSHLGNNLDVYA